MSEANNDDYDQQDKKIVPNGKFHSDSNKNVNNELNNNSKPDKQKKSIFTAFGPGIVTGASDDDPSGIGGPRLGHLPRGRDGKAGVEIDERTKREDMHRARLREVMETAIAFYHQVLTATSQASRRSSTSTAGASRTRRSRPPSSAGRPTAGISMSRARREEGHPARRARRGGPRVARPLRRSAASASSTSSAAASCSRSATRTARLPGMGGRILGTEGGRSRHRPEVPQFAGHAAVRQEPLAVHDRQGQVARCASPARR